MELLSQLGLRIRDIREEKNISQTRLSELSGIVREQISRIENGQINATVESVFKLSMGLNTPMKELLDFPDKVMIKIIESEKPKSNLKPIVKWAGGKTQLLPEIEKLMPKEFNRYFEPFTGGGALLFSLKPENVVINDFNSELVSAYRCFEDKASFDKLISILHVHESNHSEEYYLKIRELDRSEAFNALSKEEIAGRFLYLNKACFNGLYRVNSKGYFNVPSAKREKVKIYDENNFNGLLEYFNNNKIEILNTDFEIAVENAQAGDLVYFDPPYDTYDDKDSFTSYSKNGFGKDEQLRLANLFKSLDKKGVKVMLSNHNTPYINELYNGFNINVVLAKRMINSKANGRGNVEEVIVTNFSVE